MVPTRRTHRSSGRAPRSALRVVPSCPSSMAVAGENTTRRRRVGPLGLKVFCGAITHRHSAVDGRSHWISAGLLLAVLAVGTLLDVKTGWFALAFDVVAHQFYEIPVLAAIRRPSQLPLARFHIVVFGIVVAIG